MKRPKIGDTITLKHHRSKYFVIRQKRTSDIKNSLWFLIQFKNSAGWQTSNCFIPVKMVLTEKTNVLFEDNEG